MSVGEAWRQKVALSVLGESKSELIPDVVWLGVRTATAEVGERLEVDATTSWEGEGDGVTNTVELDVGPVGVATIVEAVIWDEATGGNEILVATLDEPEAISGTENVVIPIGGLLFEVA